MGECEFFKGCTFFQENPVEKPDKIEELKEKYCRNNSLNCARYMIAQAVGKERKPLPTRLLPNSTKHDESVIFIAIDKLSIYTPRRSDLTKSIPFEDKTCNDTC